MNDFEANACVDAFGKLCEEAEHNKLLSREECQYWVFEQGYLAAMQEVAKVIQLRQGGRSDDLRSQMAANRAAYQ